MRPFRALVLLSALACHQGDVTLSKAEIDADGDGYTTEVDCDDAHATVNPDAAEVCDGLDNDCDGDVDGDAVDRVEGYTDGDGDGHGDAATVAMVCELGGLVSGGDDCDDADASVHPEAAEADCADPKDYNCDGSVAWADADGDGWAACEDCDDADPDRNPAAAEVCDPADVDEDCSGAADDADAGVDPAGYAAWYADADADGFGDAAVEVDACDAPAGTVADATDCDDTTSARNPGAAEHCDAGQTDEDCSGLADDADPGVDPAGFFTWYADADADTYGDPAVAVSACAAPAGTVADATDCDDTAPSRNPGLAEVCDAADIDEDCSGAADDADAGVDPAGWSTWYGDADGDTYGDPAAATSACDQPAGTVVDDTDCDDTDASVNPAGTEVCDDGLDNDCDGVEADCGDVVYAEGSASGADGALYGDATLDYFGTDLVTGVDLDGDGATNLVVGASGAGSGKAYVYDGAFTSTPASATAFDVGILEGTSAHGVGLTLFGVHDVDSDGRDELAVSTSGSETLYLYDGEDLTGTVSVTSSAAVYAELTTTYTVSSGGDFNASTGTDEWFAADYAASSFTGEVYVYSGTTLASTVTGEAADDFAGAAVAGGPGSDVDGDGLDELFVGAWGDDTAAAGAGATYVVLGGLSGDLDLAAADLKLLGGDAGEAFGYDLGVAGDVDGDGRGDLVASAVYADDGGSWAGAVYVFCDLDPSTSPDGDVGDAEAVVVGAAAYDLLGRSETVGVGDLDADGVLDLVVGSQFADPGGETSAGAAWHVPGPLAGSFPLSDATRYATTWWGDDTSDSCGSSLGLGDLDGDGVVDLLLGCGYGEAASTTDSGTVYFFAGG